LLLARQERGRITGRGTSSRRADFVVSVERGVVPGSEDIAGQPPDDARAQQERELAAAFALAEMEHALATEAFHVALMLRESGIELDPLTFVALRVLEACVAEQVDPSEAIDALVENGSLGRSVEIATDLLDRDAA
jgi:hypothetical protein